MTDLERDLSHRLSRLAAAVPVASGQLDPVHGGAVSARQSVRLAWITPLVILAMGGLLIGLTNDGPIAPGASAAAGPIVSTDTQGAFSLTIRSAKAVYRPGDPIDVVASLAFAGPDPSIKIGHGLGVNEGPLGFGVVEPVDVPGLGLIQLGGGYRLACRTSTFQRDVPIEAPYSKGGSPLLDPPDGPTFEQLQAYMSDRVLRLPAGTWHIYAIAEFATGDCAPADAESNYSLRAEITVVVADDPAATPGPPQPTPFLNKPVYGGDDIGDFTMQLKAGHSTYVAGAPIDVSAWYTYGSGIGNSITVSHFFPEMEFSVSQVDDAAQVIRSVLHDSACQELTLADGQENHVAIAEGNVTMIKAVSWPPSTADALKEGILQLPVGKWRITAGVATSLGPCDAPGELRQLHASIEIEIVVGGTAPTPTDALMQPPLPSASPEAVGEQVDGHTVDEYGLYLRSDRFIYRESQPVGITATFDYYGRSPKDIWSSSMIAFSVVEPVNDLHVDNSTVMDSAECGRTTLVPDQQLLVPFRKNTFVSQGDPNREKKVVWIADPVLRLTAGTWHIRATATFFEEACDKAKVVLATEIEIYVLPDDATPIQLATIEPAGCQGESRLGRLVRDRTTGFGLETTERIYPVRWPQFFRAWDSVDGAILVDSEGHELAREGQSIRMRAMDSANWTLEARCEIRGFVLND